MSAKIRNQIMNTFSNYKILKDVRKKAEAARQDENRPPEILYFHKVDDPYSHLTIHSIEKLKSATRIVNESEPALVTADGLMEVSEEDMNEDFNDEDEKPKKRRRRRRKKKQFSTEEGADANLDNTENKDSLEPASTETSSSGENLGSEKVTNQRKRRKKGDNLTTVSSGSAEDFSEVEGDKIKEDDIADKNSVGVDPEEKSNLA